MNAADQDKFARYLADEMSPEEIERLSAELAAGRKTAEGLADYLLDEVLIGHALRAVRAADGLEAERAAAHSEERPRVVRGDRARRRFSVRARPPVGPLAEGRAVVPYPGARRRGARVGLAIAACLAILAGAYVAREYLGIGFAPPYARVTCAGDVAIMRGVVVMKAERETALRAGDELRAGLGATAQVRYADDGTTVTVSENTRLQFADEQGKRLDLTNGRIEVDAPPQAAEHPLRVLTAQAEIRAIGTRFAVLATAASTQVELVTGRVSLLNRANGAKSVLEAGYRAVVAGGTVVTRMAPGEAAPGHVVQQTRPSLQALYLFTEGRGPIVRDVAGVGRALDLRIESPAGVRWLPGGGLAVDRPTLIASDGPATRLSEACRASNELAVEAWIVPRDPVHAQAYGRVAVGRIVSVSASPSERNFTLAQVSGFYGLRVRTTETGPSGMFRVTHAEAQTAAGNVVILSGPVTRALTHLVATRAASGEARLYVNGACIATNRVPGDFSVWNGNLPLMLAREWTVDPPGAEPRHWLGEYYLVAIYSRALRADEVRGNCAARFPAAAAPARSAGRGL
ncbi:MAG: FecR domain-containing protein [Kiritimatiellae bacterium]|nr:FecR domain-containing protein [Kiritimatiellia bacterium]